MEHYRIVELVRYMQCMVPKVRATYTLAGQTATLFSDQRAPVDFVNACFSAYSTIDRVGAGAVKVNTLRLRTPLLRRTLNDILVDGLAAGYTRTRLVNRGMRLVVAVEDVYGIQTPMACVLDVKERLIHIPVIDYDGITNLVVMRTLRGACQMLCVERGMVALHAGGLACGGRGIPLLGSKRSGKTTTLLSGMVLGGMNVVANDLLLLELSGHRLQMYGFPTALGIRESTVAALPILKNIIKRKHHCYEMKRPLRCRWGGDDYPIREGRIHVRPHMLAAATNTAVTPSATAVCLVAPRYQCHAKTSRLVAIESSDLRALLECNCIGRPGERFPWWRYLCRVDQGTYRVHTRDFVGNCARIIPAFGLIQGKKSNASSVNILRQLLMDPPEIRPSPPSMRQCRRSTARYVSQLD